MQPVAQTSRDPWLTTDQQPVQMTFMGTISENTYITLGLMQRVWERPFVDEPVVKDILGRDPGKANRLIVLDAI